MKNGILPYLLAGTALCLSGVSAYFSIFGLSRLFAGAGVSILVMAGVMEVSKIVLTVYIHRFWEKLHLLFKMYLISAVIALVVITTMGAYGFLSAGFQTSSVQLDIYQANQNFIENKIQFFSEEVEMYNRDLDRVSETINQLSTTRSVGIQVKDDSVEGGIRNTISTVDTRIAQERLEIERQTRNSIIGSRQASVDSLQLYRQQLLTALTNNDLVLEIGPLQFLSELTDYSMAEIVNIVIIMLILVLDPLAISMILASSIGIDKKKVNTTPETYYQTGKQNEGLYKDSNEHIQEIKKPILSTRPREPEKAIQEEPINIPKEKQQVDNTTEITKDTWDRYNDILKEYGQSEVTPVKILQKSPSYYHVKMSDGSRQKIKKSELEVTQDNKIRYL